MTTEDLGRVTMDDFEEAMKNPRFLQEFERSMKNIHRYLEMRREMNEIKAEVEGLYREIELGKIMGECVEALVYGIKEMNDKAAAPGVIIEELVLPELNKCQQRLEEKKNGNRLGSNQERSSEESAD